MHFLLHQKQDRHHRTGFVSSHLRLSVLREQPGKQNEEFSVSFHTIELMLDIPSPVIDALNVTDPRSYLSWQCREYSTETKASRWDTGGTSLGSMAVSVESKRILSSGLPLLPVYRLTMTQGPTASSSRTFQAGRWSSPLLELYHRRLGHSTASGNSVRPFEIRRSSLLPSFPVAYEDQEGRR